MVKLSVFFVLFITCLQQVKGQHEFLGTWKTLDDVSGTGKSVVRIFKATNGLYYGRVEQLLEKKYQGKNPVCTPCKDDDSNKPVIGLLVVRDMKYEDGKLVGGLVLDPETGNVYYASIILDAKTNKLKLRGSIDKHGVLGRSQYWVKLVN